MRKANPAEKAVVSARMLKLTRTVREKVAVALAAPQDEQLPLVVDALDSAVAAMDAMTDRLLADVPAADLAAAGHEVARVSPKAETK